MAIQIFAQTHSRVKTDAGAETSTGWLAAVDTNVTGLSIGTAIRFRTSLTVNCATCCAPYNVSIGWQFSNDGGSTYNALTTATSGIKIAASTAGSITNGQATTQQISSGAFSAGVEQFNVNTSSTASQGADGNLMEFEVVVSTLANGTYYIRPTTSAGAAFTSYATQLTVTVGTAATRVVDLMPAFEML